MKRMVQKIVEYLFNVWLLQSKSSLENQVQTAQIRTTVRHLQTFNPKRKSSFHSLVPLSPSDGLADLSAAAEADMSWSSKPAPEAGGSLVAAKLGAFNVPKP